MSYSETDLSYLAGLIDGEGHVRLASGRSGRLSRCLVIEISMTDGRLLEQLSTIFGGCLRRANRDPLPPAWRPAWKLSWSGIRARDLATDLLPFLRSKREQVRLGLSLHPRLRRDPSGRVLPLTEEEMGEIRDIATQMTVERWAVRPPNSLTVCSGAGRMSA